MKCLPTTSCCRQSSKRRVKPHLCSESAGMQACVWSKEAARTRANVCRRCVEMQKTACMSSQLTVMSLWLAVCLSLFRSLCFSFLSFFCLSLSLYLPLSVYLLVFPLHVNVFGFVCVCVFRLVPLSGKEWRSNDAYRSVKAHHWPCKSVCRSAFTLLGSSELSSFYTTRPIEVSSTDRVAAPNT